MAVERYCLEHGREKRTRIYLSMNCTLRLLASLMKAYLGCDLRHWHHQPRLTHNSFVPTRLSEYAKEHARLVTFALLYAMSIRSQARLLPPTQPYLIGRHSSQTKHHPVKHNPHAVPLRTSLDQSPLDQSQQAVHARHGCVRHALGRGGWVPCRDAKKRSGYLVRRRRSSLQLPSTVSISLPTEPSSRRRISRDKRQVLFSTCTVLPCLSISSLS